MTRAILERSRSGERVPRPAPARPRRYGGRHALLPSGPGNTPNPESRAAARSAGAVACDGRSVSPHPRFLPWTA